MTAHAEDSAVAICAAVLLLRYIIKLRQAGSYLNDPQARGGACT